MKTFFISCFVLATSFSLHAQKTIDLFNGNDLSNWGFVLQDGDKTATDIFTIKDGVIHIKGTPFGYMYTKEKYSNFNLHVEWRWPEEASNSGIFVFVQNENKVWPNAIECQLKAGNAGDLVLLNGSNIAEFKTNPGEERPKFPVVQKFNPSPEMPVGEWNNANIICINGFISVYINGVLQNMGTESLHKSGNIALQSEGKDIQFRNVRLTPFEW